MDFMDAKTCLLKLQYVGVLAQQKHCLHCGNCYEVCPVKAVEKRG